MISMIDHIDFSAQIAKQPVNGHFCEKWAIKCITGWWARATPLKNMSSSIGMMRNSQYFWENKIHVFQKQLGLLFPIFLGKCKIHGNQKTTNHH